MPNCQEEAAGGASVVTASLPNAHIPEISARATDAILGSIPAANKAGEEGSARKILPLFQAILRYGPHAAAAACLIGVVWAGGSYLSGGRLPFYGMKSQTVEPQDSVKRAEMLRVQEMAEEIRSLRADVDAMRTARGSSAKGSAGREDLKTRLDAMQTGTGAAIADLAGKVDQLERKSSERFDRIEHQFAAAPRAASPVAAASAPGEPPLRKRVQGHDAFDPSQNPNAPGAPRPLGAL